MLMLIKEYLQPHFLLILFISFVLNLFLFLKYIECKNLNLKLKNIEERENDIKKIKETIENAKYSTNLEYEYARKIRKEAEEYSNKLEIEKKKFDEVKKKFKNQQKALRQHEEDVSKREEDVSKREEDVSKCEEDVSKSLQYIEDFKERIRCNVI